MNRLAHPLLLLLIAASAFIASCQVDPLTGKNTVSLYSYEDEKQMGDESAMPIVAELGGLYPDQAGFAATWAPETQFRPAMDADTRRARLAGWADAVRRTLSQP